MEVAIDFFHYSISISISGTWCGELTSTLYTFFFLPHPPEAKRLAENFGASTSGGPALLPTGEDSLCAAAAASRDANGSLRAALPPRQMRPPARVSRTHWCLCRGETALSKQRKTNQAFEFEHLPLTLRRPAGGGWPRRDSRGSGDADSPSQQFLLNHSKALSLKQSVPPLVKCYFMTCSRSPLIRLQVMHHKNRRGHYCML